MGGVRKSWRDFTSGLKMLIDEVGGLTALRLRTPNAERRPCVARHISPHTTASYHRLTLLLSTLSAPPTSSSLPSPPPSAARPSCPPPHRPSLDRPRTTDQGWARIPHSLQQQEISQSTQVQVHLLLLHRTVARPNSKEERSATQRCGRGGWRRLARWRV